MNLGAQDLIELDPNKLSEINSYIYKIEQNPRILDSIKEVDELNDIVYALSYKYEETRDISYLKLLKELVNKKYIPYNVRIFLMWQLVRKQHICQDHTLYKELDDCGYNNISVDMVEQIDIQKLGMTDKIEERMVILTTQFLGYQHSPTKLLLNIIKTINEKYPQIKEIYIFNSLELPISIPCYFYNPFYGGYIEYTNALFERILSIAEITRCGVGYEERNKGIPIEQGIKQLAKEIHELRPKYILNIGDHNILADLCNKYTDVYTLSISSEYPINYTKYLCKWIEVPFVQIEEIKEEQIYLMLPIELGCITNNPINGVTRKELGIREDAKVLAVVGNRLQQELEPSFLQMLNNLCRKNDKIDIVFIGDISLTEVEGIGTLTCKERVHFLGFVDNLHGTLALCDLFINPKRQGGGHGGIASMQLGIPILTIDYGDVASYLTEQFKVMDYKEMEYKTLGILNDAELLVTYKKDILEVYNQRNHMLGEHLIKYMIDNA